MLLLTPLMQSCQHNNESKEEKIAAEHRLSDAAAYNTQLGMGYLKQGDTPRAKRKLLTALSMAPDSADVNVAMAYFLEKTGDLKEAETYYKKALSLEPNSGAQKNNFGTFLCRTGKYQEAEKYFLKAVADVQYVNSSGAYENAGLCATAIPDYAKAETYFIKALEQDPQRKQSLLELSKIEMKQNQPEKALSYLQKYQQITLSEPLLLDMAIKATQQLGKTELEADYKQRFNKLNTTDYAGESNEYDSVNG